MKKSAYLLALSSLFFSLSLFSACTDDETDLGISLTDPLTQFDGIRDTLYADRAWSRLEDSMLTVNFTHGVIGNLNDGIFGRTTSELYTQVALPSSSFYLSGDIEKVVITLAKEQLFPDTAHTYSFHFEVCQLAEDYPPDTLIYSSRTLAVNESVVYCDSTLTVGPTDTLINLTLSPAFHNLIPRNGTAEEFLASMKGLRIRILPDSETGMMSINFSSPKTCMTIHYNDPSTGNSSTYTLLLGSGTEHFTRFTHDYSGTPFAAADSLGGENTLYVGPLAGPHATLDFKNALTAFRTNHPTATVHYAELQLPIASAAPAIKAPMLQARRNLNGTFVPARDMLPVSSSLETLLSYNPNETVITGLIESYLLKAFDGYHYSDKGYYRLRLPQQIQHMLRNGGDGQLRLIADSRYHVALGTVLNGINATSSTDKPKIVFVYSE